MINKVVETNRLYDESGSYIVGQILSYLNAGRKVFLQASGGSAISALQPLANWLNKFPERLDDSLVISLIDERYNPDLYSKDSNTTQINDKIKVWIDDQHEIGLIDLIENSGGYKGIYERVNHGLPKENEVNEFEGILQKYLSDDYVKMAIYGIGDDSHISGILPYPDNIPFFEEHFSSIKLADGYEVKDDRNPYKDRITTTLSAIQKIDEAIVVISGATKYNALQKALDKEPTLENIAATPATVLKTVKDVVVFSDL